MNNNKITEYKKRQRNGSSLYEIDYSTLFFRLLSTSKCELFKMEHNMVQYAVFLDGIRELCVSNARMVSCSVCAC